MAVIGLALGLAASDAQLRGVHDDDVVAGIDVRRVLRLMLAAQPGGDVHGEAPEHLVLGVDDEPALLDFAHFGGIGFHCGNSESCGFYTKKQR